MKWYFIVLMICVQSALPASRASEHAKVKFELLVHQDVADGKALGRIPDDNDQTSGNKLFPCVNTYVGLTPRLRLGKAGRHLPEDWLSRIKTPGEPKRHELTIRDNDYFPCAMVIKAGDTIVDPEFGRVEGSEISNSFRFDGLVVNSPYGAPVRNYTLHRAEPRPIKICNSTHRRRLTYVFVMDHCVGNISDQHGVVTLQDLPSDVSIPMVILYPWRPIADFRLVSPTLSIDEKGKFDVTLSKVSENRHVIHILPAGPISEHGDGQK